MMKIISVFISIILFVMTSVIPAMSIPNVFGKQGFQPIGIAVKNSILNSDFAPLVPSLEEFFPDGIIDFGWLENEIDGLYNIGNELEHLRNIHMATMSLTLELINSQDIGLYRLYKMWLGRISQEAEYLPNNIVNRLSCVMTASFLFPFESDLDLIYNGRSFSVLHLLLKAYELPYEELIYFTMEYLGIIRLEAMSLINDLIYELGRHGFMVLGANISARDLSEGDRILMSLGVAVGAGIVGLAVMTLGFYLITGEWWWESPTLGDDLWPVERIVDNCHVRVWGDLNDEDGILHIDSANNSSGFNPTIVLMNLLNQYNINMDYIVFDN